MIIFDDCLSSKGNWTKDVEIMELLFNGRHYNISYIWYMPFVIKISPELRSNFDYVFLLMEDFISNLKRTYEYYCGMFSSFDSFRKVFKEITNSEYAMVVVNKQSYEFSEKIYFYNLVSDEKTYSLPNTKLTFDDTIVNKKIKENTDTIKTTNKLIVVDTIDTIDTIDTKKIMENKENEKTDILNIITKSNCEIAKYIYSNDSIDKSSSELLLKIVSSNDAIIDFLINKNT